MEPQYNVASYLKERLEELGLEQMFGVAGNYTAAFLDTILADSESPIKISGNANELCAGFAADAYARIKGISALYVTYSVGAFTLLNTIAGSFVEQVPVVLINGAPTNKEDAMERNAGLLYSHTTGYQFVDIHMFRPITAAAERITDANQAIYQIDSALSALIQQKRPVYLEIAEDVWRAPCKPPVGELNQLGPVSIAVSEVDTAVQATLNLMTSKPKSIFWAGIELQRYGLQDEFLALLKVVNTAHVLPQETIKFVSSALSKSVISENNAYFEGCVTMTADEIEDLVGDDGCIIGIGAWTIGKDTGNQNVRSENTVLAAHGGIFIGAKYYAEVDLKSYILRLTEAFIEQAKCRSMNLSGLTIPVFKKAPLLTQNTEELGYDSLFSALGDWITKDDVMVVDAGFPLIGAQSVPIPAQSGFIAQAAWLAIGYSVPAGTGVKCACPDKRAIVVVGDGAFHETCQAVADQHAYGQNTVVFVIANGIYGIEQYLVNPNPFRTPPVDYKDPLLDQVYAYNDLPAWNISKLTEGFGGEGRKVTTVAELLTVMAEIRAKPDINFLVEVCVDRTNVPAVIAAEAAAKIGEDEIENPDWPPASIF